MGNLPGTNTAESECPMTGASKILTVSYGTFSCTLEGFDDPFNTMKAIAEYFRDLAAEDRYFGAEPPTPDAAMLHRIAEREIQRRVEAKIQDNGVILRAGGSAAADSAAIPAAAIPAVAAPGVLPAVTLPAATLPATAEAESVAARLHRIRTRHAAQTAAEPEPPVVTAPAVSLVVDVPVAEPAAASFDDSYDEDEHAEDLSAEPVLTNTEIEISDPLESLLSGAGNDLAAPEEAPLEVAPVDLPPLELPQIALTDDFADLPEAEDFDHTTLPTVEPKAPLQDDEALLASLAENLTDEDGADEETAEIGMLDETLESAAFAAEDESELLSRLVGLEAEPMAETAAPALIDTPDQAATDPAPQAQRARARVIRIRRAEAPSAPLPETSADAGFPPTATALSDEAEAALQAELAALEAELGNDNLGDENLGAAEPEAPALPAMEAIAEDLPAEIDTHHPASPPTEDDAVNRLIAQANSQMDGEETRRRQSAIAHLKAAAAATAADRGTQEDGASEKSRIEAYRNDLDRVVRPRRPVSDGLASARGTAEAAQRPSPLVLVSAQRIDRSDEASTAEPGPRVVRPVRPRRLGLPTSDNAVMQDSDQDDDVLEDILAADKAENLFAEASNFQEFADQLGATALPDLLEAAAVYCAEVLQRPEFSRPLVMRQIAGLAGQNSTAREDYLRGFGTLLRQGRIAKVKRGMFALTDRSPYLAEARKQVG